MGVPFAETMVVAAFAETMVALTVARVCKIGWRRSIVQNRLVDTWHSLWAVR